MTWQPTEWERPPTGDKPLRVRFRNGDQSKDALPASKWNWSDRAFDFDVTHWRTEE